MQSAATVLVTTASGNLGAATTAELLALGVTVRAGDRDPDRAAERHPGAEPVHLDLTEPVTFARALAGVDRVLLVRPPAVARVGPTLNRFLDAAVRAGVEHVVFSSVAGAEHNRLVPHHRVEQHLFATGLGWTVLRPGFFAQNLGSAYRDDLRDADRIHLPAGDGRVAFVDVRDLGELAADILTEPAAHRAEAYTLTGPEALSFEEVAQLLTVELGRPIRYEPASIPGYLRHLRAQGHSLGRCAVQTLLHAGLRRGDAAEVDPTLERLLDHPPRRLRDYVRDHRELWLRRSAG
ncbi:MAG: SDR family oxidoreductase [Nitriliruptoraceae bacterium]